MTTASILGLNVSFTRRRYGASQWYCWVHVELAGQWISLGDPWPCVTPKREELERDIRRLTGQPASA